METTNILQVCAQTYHNLLDIAYELELGRRGVLHSLRIEFFEENFHHLCGLHKLRDLYDITTRSRALIYRKILEGDITLKDIKKSRYFSSIEKRLFCLANLDSVLDNSDLVFKYQNSILGNYSKIQADYIVKSDQWEDITFVFVKKHKEEDFFICNSIFPMDKIDYTKQLPRLTLLTRKKIEKSSQNLLDYYSRPQPQSEIKLRNQKQGRSR